MNRWIPFFLVLAGWSWRVLALEPYEIFQKGQTLEREGKPEEALRAYLAVPGGEYAAATLARGHRDEFLSLMREAADGPRWRLVEGDVLLALGKKTEALACYRAVAAKIGATAEQGWSAGFLPPDYYPVEPPAQSEDDPLSRPPQLALPFELGPGSHRDNWLLRRFIAFEAWPEAAAEFSRIWQLHRQETWPHRRALGAGPEQRWVRPAGFTGQGLQCALDYAFFLKARGATDAAFGFLLEPCLLLDLDRNPNFDHPGEPVAAGEAARLALRPGLLIRRSFSLERPGISRSEFIRLAYGAFKEAGREDQLVAALENQIKRGENRARRVLARVRMQQGKLDEALQLELSYIAEGKFNALSAEYRRGLVYELAQKIPEAVASFEKALTLPGEAFDLADAEEEAVERTAMSAMLSPEAWEVTFRGGFDRDVLGRLLRLYSALGQTDKALEVTLRQFATQPSLLEDFNALEETARRFRAAGQEPRLTAWMTETAAASKSPAVRANLRWRLGDFGAAADDAARTPGFNETTLDIWWERFAQAGTDKLRLLLKSVVAAHPEYKLARLHLLDLDAQLGSKEAIPEFEAQLESGAEPTFVSGRGPRNRTQFKGYFDVAYRLMRLYEAHGEPVRLAALGLRIARRDKPFGALDAERFRYRNEADAPEFAEAALAIAIEHAEDEPAQTALAAALKTSPWTGARAQMERRLAGAWKPFPGAIKQTWTNAPAGAELLASDENLLCLARDERFFYSGHPWGVAVRDFAGAVVARLALGEAVRVLVTARGQVWAGTPKGLFRIAPPAGGAAGKWSLLHQPLDGDVPVEQRHSHTWPGLYDYGFDNGVYTLAADGELLWIGLQRNVQALNLRTLELRAFSFEELKAEQDTDFDRIVPTARYVWADSPTVGLRRYDRATGEWAAIMKDSLRQAVRFVGVLDDQVFGDVYVDDKLRHRPCLIDPETLEITPLGFDGKDAGMLINSTVQLLGRYGGRPAFGTENWACVLEATGGKLRSLQSVMEKMNKERRATRVSYDGPLGGAMAALESLAWSEKLFAQPAADGWSLLDLPGGARVLGSRTNRTRYEYPHEDLTDEDHEVHASDGGLFLIAAGGKAERLSAPARSGGLPADRVFAAIPDGRQAWLCTAGGLAVRDAGGRLVQHFNREDGLCADRMVGGAALAGRLYFGTGWGDSGGGLVRWNPHTATFTAYFPSDGLATGKVEAVAVEDGRLRLQYGVEYLRSSAGSWPRFRRFSPGFFDPAKGAFTPPGKVEVLTQNDVQPLSNRGGEALPFLGGYLLNREKRDGKTWLCGTRGMIVLDGSAVPKLTIAGLGAKLVEDPGRAQLAEAKARPVPAAGAREFTAALRDRNPFYRAQVLATLPAVTAELLPSVAALLDDPEVRVRGTALHKLTQSALPDEKLVPLLESRLRDPDPYLRAVAALALARRGHLPPIAVMRETLQKGDSYGNFPYAVDWTVGVLAGATQLAEAVAPHATPEVSRCCSRGRRNPGTSTTGEGFFPSSGLRYSGTRRWPPLSCAHMMRSGAIRSSAILRSTFSARRALRCSRSCTKRSAARTA